MPYFGSLGASAASRKLCRGAATRSVGKAEAELRVGATGAKLISATRSFALASGERGESATHEMASPECPAKL